MTCSMENLSVTAAEVQDLLLIFFFSFADNCVYLFNCMLAKA